MGGKQFGLSFSGAIMLSGNAVMERLNHMVLTLKEDSMILIVQMNN